VTDEAPEEGAAAIPRGRLTPRGDGAGTVNARILALGAAGFSRAEIAANLECSREELANWTRRYRTLAKALARARDLELAWWEARGREGVENGKLNATLWSKAMAGRFPDEGYGERGADRSKREAPTPGRRRPLTPRDRAKAVRLLLAESGPPSAEPDTPIDSKGEPR
jgi:hypothetical protein